MPVRLKIMGSESAFVSHASAEEQAERYRLTAKDLALKIQAMYRMEG